MQKEKMNQRPLAPILGLRNMPQQDQDQDQKKMYTFQFGDSFKGLGQFQLNLISVVSQNQRSFKKIQNFQIDGNNQSHTIEVPSYFLQKQPLKYQYEKIVDNISHKEVGERQLNIANEEKAISVDEWDKQNLIIRLKSTQYLGIQLGLFEIKQPGQVVVSKEILLNLAKKGDFQQSTVSIKMGIQVILLKFYKYQMEKSTDSIAEFVIDLKNLQCVSNSIILQIDEDNVNAIKTQLENLTKQNINLNTNTLQRIAQKLKFNSIKLYLQDVVKYNQKSLAAIQKCMKEIQEQETEFCGKGKQILKTSVPIKNIQQVKESTERRLNQVQKQHLQIQEKQFEETKISISQIKSLEISDFPQQINKILSECFRIIDKSITPCPSQQNERKDYEETIKEMEDKINNHKETFSYLEKKLKSIISINKDLKVKNQDQQNEKQKLEDILKQLLKQIEDYKKKEKDFQTQIDELTQDKETLNKTIKILEKEKSDLIGLLKQQTTDYSRLIDQFNMIKPEAHSETNSEEEQVPHLPKISQKKKFNNYSQPGH